MENEKTGSDTATQGIRDDKGFEDFVSVDATPPDTSIKTQVTTEEPKTLVSEIAKYSADLLKALEEHAATAAAFLSVVGYVMIATFGKMTLQNFVLYMAFLCFVFMLYKILSFPPAFTSTVAKKINSFLLIGFIVMLLLTLWLGRSSLVDLYGILRSAQRSGIEVQVR